jgi:hypothetical protein
MEQNKGFFYAEKEKQLPAARVDALDRDKVDLAIVWENRAADLAKRVVEEEEQKTLEKGVNSRKLSFKRGVKKGVHTASFVLQHHQRKGQSQHQSSTDG